MATLITDPELEKRLIAQRQADGTDKHDEVWEGVYVMSPMANNEHQDLVDEISAVLTIVIKWAGLGRVFPGVNVSDQKVDWQYNYRCPDIAVFLNDTKAEDLQTHWLGGPDFAIEIVSPQDRSEEKLPFYARVGVRELMLIHRDPWALVLYRLQAKQLVEAARSTTETPLNVASEVVPLNWRLIHHDGLPEIQVTHHDGKQTWTIRSRA